MNPTILAVDTSGATASVAVIRGSTVLSESTHMNTNKQHCEGLMPALDSCMTSAQVRPQDLDYIACTSGPGSFTGIRIGAATVKGLAHAANIGIIAVPTLDALAYNALSIQQPWCVTTLIVPIIDARRGQVYTATYKRDSSQLVRTNDYECILLTDVLNSLDAIGEKAVFIGDAAEASRELLEKRWHFAAPTDLAYVRASSVGFLALEMLKNGYQSLKYSDFKPFYLRKPQAERELEESKQSSTGE